jgi:hypothetical protein
MLALTVLAVAAIVGAVALGREDTRHDRAARAAIAHIHQPQPRFRSRW